MNKIFNSIDNKHKINTYVIDDICWFNIDKFEFEYYKTFLITIKDVLLYLKKNKVVYIKQYVYDDDVVLFKNSSSFKSKENTHIITTNIDIFIDEIVSVFGINKI